MSSSKETKKLIVVRIGEIALKGLNRGKFEQQLIRNLKFRLREVGSFRLTQKESRINLESMDGNLENTEEVLDQIGDVFGYVSASPVRRFPAELERLKLEVLTWFEELYQVNDSFSFKFECKRVNKHFPLRSYELCCLLGEIILDRYPNAQVDVHRPQTCFWVDIREEIDLYHELIPGQKGLPVGMSGKGLLLLSGGIDSPVAGFRMASRGMQVDAVYFHTPPYTSEAALDKVVQLARIMTRYCGRIGLHVVNFTDVQLALNELCPEDMMTVVMRRMMMRIANRLADANGQKCLITGESLGQVASQTLEALAATNAVSPKPVFRPLIGWDKDDTVSLARRIGTFETSIQPYEDCCTVFVAKHPKTHPSPLDVEKAEARLPIEDLVNLGVERTEKMMLP